MTLTNLKTSDVISTLTEYIMEDYPDLPKATAKKIVLTCLTANGMVAELRAFVNEVMNDDGFFEEE